MFKLPLLVVFFLANKGILKDAVPFLPASLAAVLPNFCPFFFTEVLCCPVTTCSAVFSAFGAVGSGSGNGGGGGGDEKTHIIINK